MPIWNVIPGPSIEDGVRRDQARSDVQRTRCDPQIIGVGGIGEWMPSVATSEAKLCHSRQECIAHWNHGGFCDCFLQPIATWCSPFSNQRAIAKLCNGCSSEKDLVAGETCDLRLESETATTTERSAEHAGVDDESHESSAAANASSSSAERSSITSEQRGPVGRRLVAVRRIAHYKRVRHRHVQPTRSNRLAPSTPGWEPRALSDAAEALTLCFVMALPANNGGSRAGRNPRGGREYRSSLDV